MTIQPNNEPTPRMSLSADQLLRLVKEFTRRTSEPDQRLVEIEATMAAAKAGTLPMPGEVTLKLKQLIDSKR